MVNAKLEKLFGGRLMAASGWGAGLGLLFSVFSQRVKISAEIFLLLDAVLAVSTAVFFLLITYSLSVAIKELEAGGVNTYPINRFKAFLGGGASLLLMFGGWALFGFDQAGCEVTKTAVVLGALVFGSGSIFVYFGVISVFTRRG
ncbi:hypothetical protein D3C76_355800 [compost metagenome]